MKHLHRHDFIWAKDISLFKGESEATHTLTETLGAWVEHQRPFIIRRPCTTPDGRVCCGIATPPEHGKQRLALTLAPEGIAQHIPPPRLTECINAAPVNWHDALHKLDDALINLDLTARVFGSIAWQSLTGLSYVTQTSDVDLYIHVQNLQQLHKLTEVLTNWEAVNGVRCDAEVSLPNGVCISCKEMATNRPTLLVRSDTEVLIENRDAILSCFKH